MFTECRNKELSHDHLIDHQNDQSHFDQLIKISFIEVFASSQGPVETQRHWIPTLPLHGTN